MCCRCQRGLDGEKERHHNIPRSVWECDAGSLPYTRGAHPRKACLLHVHLHWRLEHPIKVSFIIFFQYFDFQKRKPLYCCKTLKYYFEIMMLYWYHIKAEASIKSSCDWTVWLWGVASSCSKNYSNTGQYDVSLYQSTCCKLWNVQQPLNAIFS